MSWHNELSFVREFLKNLLDNTSTGFSFPSEFSELWYRVNEGSLILGTEDMKKYKDTRKKLIQKFCKEDDLSESAVDSALKTAVFECLDIPKCRDTDINVRLDNSLKKLWDFLHLPPVEYKCYIRIGGLEIASLPCNFGQVRFVVFNDYQLQKLKKPFRIKKPADLSDKLDAIDFMLKPLLNHPIAIVEVKARDKEAAKTLAERKVRATLECLNFFSDIIPGNYMSLFIPIERKSNSIEWATVATESGYVNTFGVFTDTDVSAGGFSIKRLFQSESSMVRSAVRRVASSLKESNKVEEVILRSVRWGGRATAEKTREESFLFFVIALECMLLPDGNSGELRYRFSQHIAQLIGRDTSERKRIMKKAKKLYDIRSNIVHSGHYEASEERYCEIRNIAKTIIYKLLTDQRIQEFHSSKQFEDWLDELSL